MFNCSFSHAWPALNTAALRAVHKAHFSWIVHSRSRLLVPEEIQSGVL